MRFPSLQKQVMWGRKRLNQHHPEKVNGIKAQPRHIRSPLKQLTKTWTFTAFVFTSFFYFIEEGVAGRRRRNPLAAQLLLLLLQWRRWCLMEQELLLLHPVCVCTSPKEFYPTAPRWWWREAMATTGMKSPPLTIESHIVDATLATTVP